MSTTKISDLPVLSSADAADEFVVVDDSAGVTKKITQGNLNVLVENADDYEEGTFSPNLSGVENESNFSVTNASYTKIGGIVVVYLEFTFDLSATTDRIAILFDYPFATGNDSFGAESVVITDLISGTGDNRLGYAAVSDGASGNQTTGAFIVPENDVVVSGNARTIKGSFVYRIF